LPPAAEPEDAVGVLPGAAAAVARRPSGAAEVAPAGRPAAAARVAPLAAAPAERPPRAEPPVAVAAAQYAAEAEALAEPRPEAAVVEPTAGQPGREQRSADAAAGSAPAPPRAAA